MFRIKSLFKIGLISLSALCRCGDGPVMPGEPAWFKLAEFPRGLDISGVEGESATSCYVVGGAHDNGSNYDRGVVYRYTNGDLVKVFVSPYDGSEFYDIEFGAGRYWCVGWKYIAREKSAPYVVTYNGVSWEELAVPPLGGEMFFRRVFPAGEGQAYFVGGLHASYLRRPVISCPPPNGASTSRV